MMVVDTRKVVRRSRSTMPRVQGIGYVFPTKSSTNHQGERNDLSQNPKKIVTREQPRVNYAEEDIDVEEGIQMNANTADAVALDINRCTRLMIACMYEKDYHPDHHINDVIRSIRDRCRLTRHYDVTTPSS